MKALNQILKTGTVKQFGRLHLTATATPLPSSKRSIITLQSTLRKEPVTTFHLQEDGTYLYHDHVVGARSPAGLEVFLEKEGKNLYALQEGTYEK